VVFAALDERVPATLSARVITDVLRRELGFAGIVVSDDLDMRAIAGHFGVGDAAVQAVRAGCDALLLCRDRAHQQRARAALTRAAESDSTTRARLAEAAGRIRAEKRRQARGQRPPADAQRALALFAEHRANDC
jgi:beta-N-acetylhexosaminidase